MTLLSVSYYILNFYYASAIINSMFCNLAFVCVSWNLFSPEIGASLNRGCLLIMVFKLFVQTFKIFYPKLQVTRFPCTAECDPRPRRIVRCHEDNKRVTIYTQRVLKGNHCIRVRTGRRITRIGEKC